MSTTRDTILRAAVDRTGEETVYDPKDFTEAFTEGSDATADRELKTFRTSLMKRQNSRGAALRGAPERPPTPEEELARLIQDALANSTDTQQA